MDVTNWLRPDANHSPDRLFCHVYGRRRSADQFDPGWPYSIVAALESGASSWTQLLDAARIGPDDDVQTVTASQLRGIIERLIAAGQHAEGDETILVFADAGYDAARLAWRLRDLPVTVTARVRSDRVLYARPNHQAAAGGAGGHRSTGRYTDCPNQTPGRRPRIPPPATPLVMAGWRLGHGIGCIRG